jgi:hypothetical protein
MRELWSDDDDFDFSRKKPYRSPVITVSSDEDNENEGVNVC